MLWFKKKDRPKPKELQDRWWDLRSVLLYQLGHSFTKWAENLHSYPYDYDWEDWQQMLADNGSTLLAYIKADEEGDVSEELDQQAREVFVWIADHLEHLWD